VYLSERGKTFDILPWKLKRWQNHEDKKGADLNEINLLKKIKTPFQL